MATLKDRLKNLRNEKGLNQEDFGKIFGLVKSTISMYENGHSTPDDELKKKFAKFFDVSLDYLMGESDIKEPAEKLLEKNKDNEYTIALHNNNGYDEELPEEARKEIDNFIEFVKQKYGKKE